MTTMVNSKRKQILTSTNYLQRLASKYQTMLKVFQDETLFHHQFGTRPVIKRDFGQIEAQSHESFYNSVHAEFFKACRMIRYDQFLTKSALRS